MDNKLTKDFTARMLPKMALVVYESELDDSLYLEQRTIIDGRMGAGVPVTMECLREIAELATSPSQKEIHGAIPSNMLYADSRKGYERYVWYRPAEKRMHYYSSSLHIPDGELCTPPLLYVVNRNELALYAFIGDGKPRSDEQLYRAPFFNVSSDHVCLGNARLPEMQELTYANIIAYWEKMFWASAFSHILDGNPVKGNLAVLTKRLMASGEPFPTDELVKVRFKLSDFMKI